MVHWKSSVMSVMHTSALCREHGSPYHLGQNIRIYQVVNGVRHMIQNFDHVIDIRHWHRLRVQMRGCDVRVWFDEQAVFTLCDHTFAKGRVGLWTKSDAVTYFDDVHLQKTR